MKLSKLHRYGILKSVAQGVLPTEFTDKDSVTTLTEYPFGYLMIVASDTLTLGSGDVILKGSVISIESEGTLFIPVMFKKKNKSIDAYYNQFVKFEGEAVLEGDVIPLNDFVVDGTPLFESVYIDPTVHMAPYVLK